MSTSAVTFDPSTIVGMDDKPIPPVTFDSSTAVGLDDKPIPPQTSTVTFDPKTIVGMDDKPIGPVNPYAGQAAYTVGMTGPPQGPTSPNSSLIYGGPGIPSGLRAPAPAAPAISKFTQENPRLSVSLGDPTTPEYAKLSHDIGATEYQQSQDQLQAAKDVSGISGVETAGTGVVNIAKATHGDLSPTGLGAAFSDLTTRPQALTGLTQTIAGGGQVAMVLGAPEIGGIFRTALGGEGVSVAEQLAAKVAMFKIIRSVVVGTGSSVGAGAIAHAVKVSPEAENLIRTSFFFIPSVMGGALAINERLASISPDTAGYSAETPGGKFGVGVKQSPEGTEVRAGIKGVGSVGVGPRGVTVERPGGPQLPGGEGEAPTTAPPVRPAPPSAPEVQANAQIAEVTRLAATAQGNQVAAEQLTGMRPPPPPKPKIPSPAGMDDGHLSQQTVETAGQVIQSLPPAARPSAILEAVNKLTAWMAGKGTVLGPDDQVVNVDSPKSAQAAATKIINAEMEKQKTQAEDAADEKEENLATAQEERDEAITPTKEKSEGSTPAVVIPKSPQVDRARAAIQGAPADATADHFDQIIRKTALVTTPVRKALVEEEVNRRANLQEDHAATAMNGQPAAPGQSRTELQMWADGVKNGEHPFLHIPAKSDFVPAGVDGLTKTKVSGAGAFGGTYYHADEISAADIRKAARDKNDPQAALDAIVAAWKGKTNPVELSPEEVGSPGPIEAGRTEQPKGGRGESPEPAGGGEVAPVAETESPTLASVKRQNPPQVAQPTKVGPVKFEATDRLGRRIPLKGDEYIFPGFEEYRIAVTKPRGSIANHDKLGWESHEIATGTRIYAEPFQNSTEEKTVAGTLMILKAQGKPKIDGAIEHWLQNPPKPKEPPVTLTPEAATGLSQIVEAAKADDPAATLDSVLRHPADGKIITQALVNDGIITDSASDVNPTTSLLTTRGRTKVGDALLSTLLGPELTEQTPPFVREKLLGSMGSIGSIAETGPEWNLKPALEQAVAQYGAAFRGEDTQDAGPVVDALVKKLDGSPEEMRKAFSNYAVSASSPGDNPNPVLDFNVAFGTELTAEQFDQGLKAKAAKAMDDQAAVIQKIETQQIAEQRRALAEKYRGRGISYPDSENMALKEIPVTPEESAANKLANLRDYAGGTIDHMPPRIRDVDEAFAWYQKAQLPNEILSEDEFAKLWAEKQATKDIIEHRAPASKPLAKGDKVIYRTNKGKERTGEVAWTDGKKVRITDNGSTVNKSVDDVKLANEVHSSPESNGEATLVDALQLAFDGGRGPKDYNGLKKIVAEFDRTEPSQLRMKEAQEAYEAMLNRVASEIVLKGGSNKEIFSRMVRLYEGQPNLAIRTSTSIDNQAYSTPLPLAFVADRFAGIEFKHTSVYEPTAGNGALLIAADPAKTYANEFNPARAATLKAEGFQVSQQDATTFVPPFRVDAVVANPPFGKLAGPIKFDGYTIVKLDHLIAAKALGAMKDEGRAAIILGAGSREEPGEVTNAARPFFNWLYSHYNVVSDFELDGDLYARQGASFPVRVIAIDGRTRTAKVSPVAEDIQRLKTWEEVYAKASEHLGSNLEGRPRTDDGSSSAIAQSSGPQAIPDVSGSAVGQGNPGEPGAIQAGHSGDGQSIRRPGSISHTGRVPDPPVGSPDITARSDGDVAQSDRLAEGEPAPRVVRREPAEPNGRTANAAVAKISANGLADEGNQFQGDYVPFSEKKDVGVVAPKALIDPMHAAMDMIAKDVGDIDQFVMNELGYPDLDELHSAFMGIQVDALAAAIYQAKRGKAVIIGDQTGRGKGRIAAGMQRWSDLHGHLPIFITEGANGFSAMAEDLENIGSGDTITPLLVNAGASVTNSVTGEKSYRNMGSMGPVIDRIRETGQLPAGRNALWLTYSQINKGGNRQQMMLHRLAPNAIFILDESHNAAGASNTGQFIAEVINKSKGVTFLSATWAKRPDNLPVYAGMTDMSIAIPDRDKIVDAITAGGAPLQAVLTNLLTQAGQFVRRETSFDGIEIKSVVDYDNQGKHEKISDSVTECLRAIMDADAAFHNSDFQDILSELDEGGMSGDSKEISVSHMEFSSIVHNLTKQLLLAMKADGDADKMIAAIENGEKPLYAVENTMGSFLTQYIEVHNLSEGDPLPGLTYAKIVNRALDRTRYYNRTDETGEKTRIEVPLDKLSPAVRELYDAAQALIDKLDVDLPVSPIDHIRNRMEKAGYKIAEITGRDWRIDYSGQVPRLAKVGSLEKKDRVNTANQFNNGSIHGIIFNKAGASMISLHASEKFLNQQPRHMIVGQAAGDVNVVIQTLGRTNRTGQVQKPIYTLSAVALPAEMRPAIVISKKMKSLNANVSSNTRSATSVKAVDMFNKYGDKIVAQYLIDNPEMARLLGIEAGVDTKGEPTADEGTAMKATGHSALLTVKEQQTFMDAITEAYTNYINFLDETGQNDLEPVTYDYDARETHKERMYQGTDPSSPFGQDAHYGEYSIKRQGKSFTPEEVNAKIAETFGPEVMKLAPYQRDTLFARDLAAHYEELYTPYLAGLKTDASIGKAAEMRSRGRNLLNEYRVGSAFGIDIGGETAHAVVTNIEGSQKTSGNPYAPSSLQFTLAVNSPLRQIKVPGSQISKITTSNLGRNADIAHLFRDIHGDSRQKAKIITGNLLGAYGELKAGVKGRIISFTMADGTTQLGIQMPTKFDIKTEVSETYAMRSPDAALKLLQSGNDKLNILGTGDRVLTIFGRPEDNDMEIRTMKSKAAGGKFFLDPRLRELVVGGDFVSSGGVMKATVKEGSELDALKVIMGKAALYVHLDRIKEARELDEKAQAGTLSKPSGLQKAMGGEEGFVELGALIPPSIQKIAEKVGNYLRKAVPATWGELAKATGVAVKTPKAIGYEIASVLYPAMLARPVARDIMGRALGQPALELFSARLFLDGIDKMFEGMPEKDWVEFVDRIHEGKEQPTPDLQNAQVMMTALMEAQRSAEQTAANLGRKPSQDKIVLQDRAGYFPHRYSTPPGKEKLATETEQIARIGLPKRPFEGSKSFMKQQKYETLKEAVADGGVMLGNPVKMVLRRIHEGAKYVASQEAWWNGRQVGLIVYKSPRGKMPENFVKTPDNIAKISRPVETAEGDTVFVNGGEWVMEKDFARLFNNYLSKDIIRGSTVGQGFVQLKTSSTAFKMAFSPFHYGMITFWGMVEGLHSGIDEAYNQGVRGLDPEHLAGGAKKIAMALVNPVAKTVQGNRIIKHLKNPQDFLDTPAGQKMKRDYPDLDEMLRLVFAGGFRMGTNEDFPEKSPMSIGKDLKAGRGWSAAKKVIPFGVQAISWPLFNFVIPRMKLMANVQMLSQKLEQYSQAIDDGSISPETIARQVVATNENSFGEFNYQELYWNNTFKTAMQTVTLALGWKIGTWRSPAQAAKEVFTEGYVDKFYKKVEAEGKADDWSHKYASKLPQLGLNTGRLLAAAIIATTIATIVNKMHKGKWIWQDIADDVENHGLNILEATDLEVLHPHRGKDNQYGEPIRYNLPSDLRDYEHATLNPGLYAFNSLAPWLIGTINTLNNRDYAGNYIYDPAARDGKFKQGLYYNLSQSAEPIGVSNYLKKGGPQDRETKIEQTVGLIGGAPKGWDETRSVAHAKELKYAHDPHAPMTPAQQSEKAMLVAAGPTRYQAKYALRTRNLTELDKIVMSPGFSYTDAKDVYDHATAEEKATLRPIMMKKQAAAVKKARGR